MEKSMRRREKVCWGLRVHGVTRQFAVLGLFQPLAALLRDLAPLAGMCGGCGRIAYLSAFKVCRWRIIAEVRWDPLIKQSSKNSFSWTMHASKLTLSPLLNLKLWQHLCALRNRQPSRHSTPSSEQLTLQLGKCSLPWPPVQGRGVRWKQLWAFQDRTLFSFPSLLSSPPVVLHKTLREFARMIKLFLHSEWAWGFYIYKWLKELKLNFVKLKNSHGAAKTSPSLELRLTWQDSVCDLGKDFLTVTESPLSLFQCVFLKPGKII